MVLITSLFLLNKGKRSYNESMVNFMNNLYVSLFDYISGEHLLLIIMLLLISAIAIIILFLIIKKHQKQLKTSLNKNYFGRQYRLDLENKKVNYFDISTPEDFKTCTLDQFIGMFRKKDGEAMMNWLTDLCDKEYKGNTYFECLIHDNTCHDDIYDLFNVRSVLLDKKMIFLESFRFPDISHNKISRKNKGLFTNEEALLKYYKGRKTKSVAIYYIHLYSKQEFRPSNIAKERLIIINIVQVLLKNLKKNCFIYTINTNNLCFIDFHPKDDISVRKMTDFLRSDIDVTLSLQSSEINYTYRIGAYYNQNYDSLSLKDKLRYAEEAAIYAKNTYDENSVSFYDKSINYNHTKHSKKIDEMNHILQNNLFQIQYTPYVDSKSGRTKGFMCSISINSKIFSSLKELEATIHQQEKTDEYVELILENCLHGLEDPSLKRKAQRILIIPMPLYFFANANKYLSSHPIKDVRLSFMADQEDFLFLSNAKGVKEINKLISDVAAKGFSSSIQIDNTQININDEILKLFNCFILDDEFVYKNVTHVRGKILIDHLLDQLSSFKVPIIANGIQIWSHAELLASLGVQYLSGPAIASPSENISDVPRKITQRIIALNS